MFRIFMYQLPGFEKKCLEDQIYQTKTNKCKGLRWFKNLVDKAFPKKGLQVYLL